MACGSCCFGKLIELGIIYGYPGNKVLKQEKKENLKKYGSYTS